MSSSMKSSGLSVASFGRESNACGRRAPAGGKVRCLRLRRDDDGAEVSKRAGKRGIVRAFLLAMLAMALQANAADSDTAAGPVPTYLDVNRS